MVAHNLKLLYFLNKLNFFEYLFYPDIILIIDPKYSSGVIIVALIHGSSINFINVGSGKT